MIKYPKTLVAGAAAIIGTGMYLAKDSPYHVYMYGSETVPHDQAIADLVDSDVTYGLYCTNARPLIVAKEGDVFISGRADSYTCQYTHTDLLGIAVVGASNATEDVGNERIPNSIYVSNGRAYGGAVDFIILTGNLGDAMAYMANDITQVNLARDEANLSVLNTAQMRQLFNAAAADKVIDMELAIEYAVNGLPAPEPSEPCEDCSWLPGAVYYPLLLD